MPGIFHALFGCTIGLLLWKITEGKDGAKRYSLPLIFVFAFNNYIGPDLGAIFKSIARAFDSDAMMELYKATHSYFGFVLFAIPYAIAWYAILLGIEQARERNLKKAGSGTGPGAGMVSLHASYPKVLVMVVAGGFMHHFVDSLGHSPDDTATPGIYYPSGRFTLIPPMQPAFWLAYGIIIAIIAVIVAIYLIQGVKSGRFTLREKVTGAFTKEMTWGAAFVGIGVLNTFMMYGIMAWGNLVVVSSNGISFYLGNALQAAILFEREAIWWIAAAAAPTLILFFLANAKAWRVRIARQVIRADLLVVLCFITAIVVGYALQPVIGNISGTEADVGVLIYTWSTVGSMLVGFIIARSRAPLARENNVLAITALDVGDAKR